jgi:lipopolysaccharide transport system ATP-binding protein
MDDVLVKVENISKKFCMDFKRSLFYGLKDLGSELLGRSLGGRGRLREKEFWALNSISFELRRGEFLGLIGHNGAGKTTLLRVLYGLIRPDAGRIELRGRVGALIALGAGFNPILTGRENIYVNAAVLGMSKKKTDNKLEEIIDFAEIEEFIDSPVQSYSSGMSVRLGFAIAAILIKPDILFLDEVLAVGDVGFATKCLNTMRQLALKSAIIFVSHNMQYVSSFCTRVMILEKGIAINDSNNPSEGIDQYYKLMKSGVSLSGSGEAIIQKIDLIVDGSILEGAEPSIEQGASVWVRLLIKVERIQCDVIIHLSIMDEAMSPILVLPVCDAEGNLSRFPTGEIEVEFALGPLELAAGKYSIVMSVSDFQTRESLARIQGARPFRVFAKRAYWGKFVRPVVARQITPKN